MIHEINERLGHDENYQSLPGSAELVRPLRPWSDQSLVIFNIVKALYFQSSGRTNNCQIVVLYKWSDQSCTPSAASDYKICIF